MYIGILSNEGVNVSDQDAFQYVKDHLDELPDEDKLKCVQFYFSGDFIHKEEEECRR